MTISTAEMYDLEPHVALSTNDLIDNVDKLIRERQEFAQLRQDKLDIREIEWHLDKEFDEVLKEFKAQLEKRSLDSLDVEQILEELKRTPSRAAYEGLVSAWLKYATEMQRQTGGWELESIAWDIYYGEFG